MQTVCHLCVLLLGGELHLDIVCDGPELRPSELPEAIATQLFEVLDELPASAFLPPMEIPSKQELH